MKHHHYEPDLDTDLDDLSPAVSAHIEHLSRKWADDEDRQGRVMRRGPTRRRIEDWREERALQRQLQDELDLD